MPQWVSVYSAAFRYQQQSARRCATRSLLLNRISEAERNISRLSLGPHNLSFFSPPHNSHCKHQGCQTKYTQWSCTCRTGTIKYDNDTIVHHGNQRVNYFTRWLEMETFREKKNVSYVFPPQWVPVSNTVFQHCWFWRCEKSFVLERKQISFHLLAMAGIDLCSICTPQTEHDVISTAKFSCNKQWAIH